MRHRCHQRRNDSELVSPAASLKYGIVKRVTNGRHNIRYSIADEGSMEGRTRSNAPIPGPMAKSVLIPSREGAGERRWAVPLRG